MRQRDEKAGDPSPTATCSFCLGLTAGLAAAAAGVLGGIYALAAAFAGLVLAVGHVLAEGPWRRGLAGFGLGVFSGAPLIAAFARASGDIAGCASPSGPTTIVLSLIGLGLATAAAVPLRTSPDPSADRVVRGGLVVGMTALSIAAAAWLAPPCASLGALPVGDVTGSIGLPALRQTLP